MFPVFQRGIRIATETGLSLHTLFHQIWGLSDEFVENRIGSVFLDGKPVDNLGTAIVADGAVIALSSAMPGLVGATMRRGGVLAGFRSGISHREENQSARYGNGTITVKLFNMLIKELGPIFLELGFQVDSSDLTGLLPNGHPMFENGPVFVTADRSM